MVVELVVRSGVHRRPRRLSLLNFGSVEAQAIYDDDGVLESARRFVDGGLVVRCQRFIQDLYEAGEPFEPFFASHVATLLPPGQP